MITVARTAHRKIVREFKVKDAVNRDSKLMKDPKATYAQIRASKRCATGKVQNLTVGDEIFIGDDVKTGFFMAINELKTRKPDCLLTSTYVKDFISDYLHILELCKMGNKIPQISEEKSLLRYPTFEKFSENISTE